MKKSGFKTAAIILLILQIALSIFSFIIIAKIFENQQLTNIYTSSQLFLYIFLALGIFIPFILVVFIFRLKAMVWQEQQNLEIKTVELSQKEKKRIEKKQEQVKQEELESRRVVLEKLNNDLAGISQIDLFTEKVLINISKVYNIMQGIFFVKDLNDNVFRRQGAYAYYSEDELREFTEEVGLSGQVAFNKRLLNITNIPDKYITVLSGLGKASPANLLIFPVLYNNESIGVIELASFVKFDATAESILMEFSVQIGALLTKLQALKETSS